MEARVATLGLLPLMLVRRAAKVLAAAGIAAEIFRDDAVLGRAQAHYTTAAGLAYLRVLSFDPDAFGISVPAAQARGALRVLASAGIRVSLLEASIPVDDEAERPPILAGEPPSHPYREALEERVCLRCGEPEMPARPPGALCGACGGMLGSFEAYQAARRRSVRRWAALFVLALLAFGIASPRFAACVSTVQIAR